MALVPTTYPHLCSNSWSPSPRATHPLFSPSKLVGFGFSNKCWPLCSGMAKELKPWVLVKASEGESQITNQEEQYEEYEVEIEQPYGLKFRKGRDGGTYIDAILPGGAADKAGVLTVGDKVLATRFSIFNRFFHFDLLPVQFAIDYLIVPISYVLVSCLPAEQAVLSLGLIVTSNHFYQIPFSMGQKFAVFGTEIWPAAEYGRTMYTIRQRIGPLLMKMQKRYGQIDEGGELTEKEIIRAERNSGVISNRVREIQMQNYIRKREQKEGRERDLREGLQLYRSGEYEQALEKFESVLGSKPEPEEAAVASYNVACCYSKLNQIQAGLSALEDALQAGFEEFKRIREDPDLANLKNSEQFEPLLKRFDESFINENAINAIKSLFGIFNQK